MYNLTKVANLHIELTSKCNASCPACPRNIDGGPLSPDLKIAELYYDDVAAIFDNDIVKQLGMVNYCGSQGDPAVSSDLPKILNFFQTKNSNPNYLVQQIRTNAGIHSADYWTELGNFFASCARNNFDKGLYGVSCVVFSVDGLEDTNHLYRRGVKWDNVYRNMKAYSATGAKGVWEFLKFKHNEHQIVEAEALARELNLKFVVKNPLGFSSADGGMTVRNKAGEYEYTLYPASQDKVDAAPAEPAKLISIFCKATNTKTQDFYITAEGYVVPCCWIGGIFGQPGQSASRRQFQKFVDDFDFEQFNVRKHPLEDILTGPAMGEFYASRWKNNELLFCAECCGQDSHIDKVYPNE